MKTPRYALEEADGYGFWVIDTTVEDGENCAVTGSTKREEAQALCDRLNAEEEARRAKA